MHFEQHILELRVFCEFLPALDHSLLEVKGLWVPRVD